jgi:DNA-binding transcriptional LysR family regulator
MGLSQPAISSRIQHLEQVIGVPLFHRTTRRVALTDAGERLRIRTTHTIEELRQLLVEFDDEAHMRRGRIGIGAAATVSSDFLGAAITSFHSRQSRVEISLFDDFYGRALERLTRSEVDLAILPSEPDNEIVTFERLFSDPLHLVVAKSHRLADRDVVRLDELRDEMFVTIPPRCASWDEFVRTLPANESSFRPVLQTRNPFAVLAIIAAGLGIGFLPRMLADTLNLDNVVLLPMAEKDLSRDIGITTLKGRALSPAATAFIETLRHVAKERSPPVGRARARRR